MCFHPWSYPPSSFHQRGSAMNRTADPLISAAAADVGDAGIDIGIARLRVRFQERRGRHDLPGLAIAALRHVLGKPGLLDRMLAVMRQTFDRDDLRIIDR